MLRQGHHPEARETNRGSCGLSSLPGMIRIKSKERNPVPNHLSFPTTVKSKLYLNKWQQLPFWVKSQIWWQVRWWSHRSFSLLFLSPPFSLSHFSITAVHPCHVGNLKHKYNCLLPTQNSEHTWVHKSINALGWVLNTRSSLWSSGEWLPAAVGLTNHGALFLCRPICFVSAETC